MSESIAIEPILSAESTSFALVRALRSLEEASVASGYDYLFSPVLIRERERERGECRERRWYIIMCCIIYGGC